MARSARRLVAEGWLAGAAVLTISFLAVGAAQATEYNFMTLTVPDAPADAIFASAVSINDLGQVIVQAGSAPTFCCTANDLYNIYTHAYTPLPAYPGSGAQSTAFQAINNAGEMVGFYHPAGGAWQGFSYAGGSFGGVNAFGDGYNLAYGVSNNGEIVGAAAPVPSSGPIPATQGYAYSGGSFSAVNPLPYPANSNTAFGVNDSGEIVVTSQPASSESFTPISSFLDVGGSFNPISMPGEQYTAASGINDAGVVVGGASSDGFVTGPGFIDSNGVFTAVNVPGATETYIYAINNLDQIAGGYFVGTNFYAFVGTPVPNPQPGQ